MDQVNSAYIVLSNFFLLFLQKLETAITLLEVQDIPPDTHLHRSRILPDILAEPPIT